MLVSGTLGQLLDYWHSLPRDLHTTMPTRAALQPHVLRDILPRIALMKRLDRYEILTTIVGTDSQMQWLTPVAGMNAFDFTSPGMRENTARLYEAILEQPTGVVVNEYQTTKNRAHRKITSLYLPLTDRNGFPIYIMGCSICDNRSHKYTACERLTLNSEKISDIEFIDIGTGLPTIRFEHTAERLPQSSPDHWWSRFMPQQRARHQHSRELHS